MPEAAQPVPTTAGTMCHDFSSVRQLARDPRYPRQIASNCNSLANFATAQVARLMSTVPRYSRSSFFISEDAQSIMLPEQKARKFRKSKKRSQRSCAGLKSKESIIRKRGVIAEAEARGRRSPDAERERCYCVSTAEKASNGFVNNGRSMCILQIRKRKNCFQ